MKKESKIYSTTNKDFMNISDKALIAEVIERAYLNDTVCLDLDDGLVLIQYIVEANNKMSEAIKEHQNRTTTLFTYIKEHKGK